MDLPATTIEHLRDEAYAMLSRRAVMLSLDHLEKKKAHLATTRPPFAGRIKRQLGDAFGLSRFGVNLTVLPSGAQSALLHRHTEQEEFIYILSGHPTLRTDAGEVPLEPGMCVGFSAG
eukprot:gene8383-10335_t